MVFRKIADTGGVVGVIFMNYWLMPHETKRGINFISHTLDHFVNVAGIDHVGVGTDFDGFTDLAGCGGIVSYLSILQGCQKTAVAKIR